MRPPVNGAPTSRWTLPPLPAGVSDMAGLAVALFGLVLLFSFTTNNFLSSRTFLAIANQIPDIAILAVGMTLVLMVGGIDLSVGSVMAFSSALLALALIDYELPLVVALAMAVLLGFLCGVLNGWITVRWRLPSFIVTLGMLEAARGGAYLATSSRTVYLGERLAWLTESKVLGLPIPFLLALSAVLAGHVVLNYTRFGRYVSATGYNEEALRLSGVNPEPIKVAVFAICGGLAGVAGLVQASRLFSVNPNAGIGIELQVIAAVVIGGTSLMGGRGSVVRSFIGVVVIAVLGTGLAQMGVQEPAKRVITGLVIVATVIGDYYRQRGLRAAS